VDRGERRIRPSDFHVGGKHPALAAKFHLLLPAFLRLSPADRSIDKPAEVSRLKFPCRAGSTGFRRATADLPAGRGVSFPLSLQSPQEEQLPLDMDRHSPPSLLETLQGPQSGSQKVGHLPLSSMESFAERYKFSSVQPCLLKGPRPTYTRHEILLDRLYHNVINSKRFSEISFLLPQSYRQRSFQKST
jgi:hypothetical protein